MIFWGFYQTTLEGYAGTAVTGRVPRIAGSDLTREVTFWLIDDPHFADGRWVRFE